MTRTLARAALVGCLLALATCEMPLGRKGEYGRVGLFYRLPDLTLPHEDAPVEDGKAVVLP